MSEMTKAPQDGTPVILAVYQDGKLWYDPRKKEMILAATCSTASQDGSFLEGLLRAAAALIGAAKDTDNLEMRFLHYVGLVREQMPAFRRQRAIQSFKIKK